jgi:DNA-binding response OmpR family regulator
MKVLVVDDDESQVAVIASVLRARGWGVCWTVRGKEVLRAHRDADIVIVGLGEPDPDGLALVAKLCGRRLGAIVVASDGSNDSGIVSGLRYGAHDYLVKPIQPSELLACVEQVSLRVRRLRGGEDNSADEWWLDSARRIAAFGGRRIRFTDIEFRIVSLLAARAGRVVPRAVLLEHVWGTHYESFSRSLDVHLSAIRAKLPSPRLLVNVRGVGFYLARDAVRTRPLDT